MVVPADVQAVINKARAIQAEQERCERLGGHYFFGTGPSKILYPEWDYPPGQVIKDIFAGKLHRDAAYSGPWVCSKCGCHVSQEQAREYINTKRERAAYFHSRLWC